MQAANFRLGHSLVLAVLPRIIYNVTSKDNEEKSAKKAMQYLRLLDYPEEKTKKCNSQILATKLHAVCDDMDTNLFTDADLSILGSEPNDFVKYSRQVRKEYSIYPDFLYKPGRAKVLRHFLDMEYIFKTPFFRDRYEMKAKENLLAELKDLEAKK